MNRLVLSTLVFGLTFGLAATSANASESILEKLASAARSEARQMEKGTHRFQEILCLEGTVTCTAKKAVNRAMEAGTAVGDGAVTIKNQLD